MTALVFITDIEPGGYRCCVARSTVEVRDLLHSPVLGIETRISPSLVRQRAQKQAKRAK